MTASFESAEIQGYLLFGREGAYEVIRDEAKTEATYLIGWLVRVGERWSWKVKDTDSWIIGPKRRKDAIRELSREARRQGKCT